MLEQLSTDKWKRAFEYAGIEDVEDRKAPHVLTKKVPPCAGDKNILREHVAEILYLEPGKVVGEAKNGDPIIRPYVLLSRLSDGRYFYLQVSCAREEDWGCPFAAIVYASDYLEGIYRRFPTRYRECLEEAVQTGELRVGIEYGDELDEPAPDEAYK